MNAKQHPSQKCKLARPQSYSASGSPEVAPLKQNGLSLPSLVQQAASWPKYMTWSVLNIV